MKTKPVILASALALTSAVSYGQIASWTFETSQPATAGPFAPEVGSGSATGFHSGTTFPTTTYSSPSGDGSAHSFSSNGWSVGDYYQFVVSTLGFSDPLTISWDQTSSNTGPKDYTLQTSTDGTSFTVQQSYSVLANASPNPTWTPTLSTNLFSFSFSIKGLTGASNLYIRLVDADTTSANGGTVAAGGTDRVDNFTVSAISPVPEPEEYAALFATGLAAFALYRRQMAK